MRGLLFLLPLLFLWNKSSAQVEMLETDSFGSNPGNLAMFVHYKGTGDHKPVPLVVFLHGCGQTAKSAAELSGWNKLADLNDFVLLYPQQKLLNNPNMCFSWYNSGDVNKHQGENESIFQMIAYVRQHYTIDSSRIFVTGLSAGAAMAVAMCATYPGMFREGAIFAGGPYKAVSKLGDAAKGMLGNLYVPQEKLVSLVREQNPGFKGAYPPLLIYHGLKDPVVHHRNADLLISQWAGLYAADTIPEKVDSAFAGVKDMTRKEYRDASGKTAVVYYEVKDIGHRLLVKPGEKNNEGGKTGILGVDRGFHSTWYTAKEFGILRKE